jgi:hypothetical protein
MVAPPEPAARQLANRAGHARDAQVGEQHQQRYLHRRRKATRRSAECPHGADKARGLLEHKLAAGDVILVAGTASAGSRSAAR